MHCMSYALGSTCSKLCEACDHQHVNTCVECNQLPILIEELRSHTNLWTEQRLVSIEAAAQKTYWSIWHSKHDWDIHTIPYGMVYESLEHQDWVKAGKRPDYEPTGIATVDEQINEVHALREGMLEHIDLLHGEVKRYVAHLVRKHKASQGQMDLLSQVTATQALVFIDYKQKVLQ